MTRDANMSTVLLPNYSKEGREKIAVVESKRNRSPVTAAQLREKGTHTHTQKKTVATRY